MMTKSRNWKYFCYCIFRLRAKWRGEYDQLPLKYDKQFEEKIIIKFHFRVLYAWIEVDWLTNMIKNLATGNIMNKKIVVKRHISMSCQRNFRICALFFLVRGVKRTTYLLLWSDFSILPLFVFNHSGFVYAAKHIHVSCL